MYLFLAFFNEDVLTRGKIYLAGKYLESVKSIFSDYKSLNDVPIKGCIGFLKGKVNADRNCYILRVDSINAADNSLTIQFEREKELNTTNQDIDRSLYKFAIQSNWINKENKFYPSVCIVEKNDFDNIRKGTVNIRKISSYTAKIDKLKMKNDWAGICNMYEPLERIHEIDEIWNNVSDLYNIAFASSKLGEPQNGLEKDKHHLSIVKRYRDQSIKLFKRCCELEPNNFRYPSSLAYRYYQNVMELSKPKGRRDGKVADEILNAIGCLDEAIGLNPNSIKDNYRKGKLIIDKQIPNFIYSQKEWNKEVFAKITTMEVEGIRCLEKCIERYEKKYILEGQGKRYFSEYIKSLYCLGCYYLEKPKVLWNEFACSILLQVKYANNMIREEMDYIVKAREVLERCFVAEANFELDIDIDARQLANQSKNWVISSIDKTYRLGLVYLHMFFVKLTKHGSEESTDAYGKKAEAYLNIARLIGEEYRKLKIISRNISYIHEKLAWYYIFTGDYDKAIKMSERLRDSYTKNTYSIALMLSSVPDRFNLAEVALKAAESDKYNMASDISKALLVYLYKLSGQENKYNDFLSNTKEKLNSSGKRLISLLQYGDLYENR